MTNEEIKKGLKICSDGDSYYCGNCPYSDNYTTCTDRLKVDARELIIKQEQELNQLKTECTLLDDELRNARQETINVLNKLKERAVVRLAAIETYHICNLIDELIKEVLNVEDKS